MEFNQSLAGILNELIHVNNNRIEGYQKSLQEAGEDDIDLKAIFRRMADESRQHISQLSHEMYELGEEPATVGTIVLGKIHRTWIDIKTAFIGNRRLALLESCEFEEDAVQKAYQKALESNETLPINVRQLIEKQKEALKVSHDTIEKFRDMHKKADSDDIVNSSSLRTSDNDLRSEKWLSGGKG